MAEMSDDGMRALGRVGGIAFILLGLILLAFDNANYAP